jgi:hypothetical protein
MKDEVKNPYSPPASVDRLTDNIFVEWQPNFASALCCFVLAALIFAAAAWHISRIGGLHHLDGIIYLGLVTLGGVGMGLIGLSHMILAPTVRRIGVLLFVLPSLTLTAILIGLFVFVG